MNVNEINYKDRSEFLRGFSVIIRKNNRGHGDLSAGYANEKIMFTIMGKYFGFDREFCEKSLEHLMINRGVKFYTTLYVV